MISRSSRMRAFLVLLLIAIVCVSQAYHSGNPEDPFVFDVEVGSSAKPSDIWVNAVEEVMKVRGWEHSYKPIFDFINNITPGAGEILDSLDGVLSSFGYLLSGPVVEEITGIYNVVKKYAPPNTVSFGRFILLNMFYDLNAGCTSFVASSTDSSFCSGSNCVDPTRGTIVHGRNLDFDIPGLQNITAVVNYKVDGTAVVRGVSYIGYVGVLTGYRINGWSVSVDQRDLSDWSGDELPLISNILSFLIGGQSVGVFLRSSLLNLPTYDQARFALATYRLAAPVYLIIGGLHGEEGAVITRTREGTDVSAGLFNGIWSIDNKFNNSFFRSETNDDHWLPARDTRRDTINNNLINLGRSGINKKSVLAVLDVKPTLNSYTTFISVMSAALDVLHVQLRFPRSTSATSKQTLEAEAEIAQRWERRRQNPGFNMNRLV